MTQTTKQKVLIGIGRRGRLDDHRILLPETETDGHNLIHLLYSLSRQGLVKFNANKTGAMQRPKQIRLTPRGETVYQELTK